MDPTTTYAWCFSHGRMHKFVAPEGPWCSASWLPLGEDEEAAYSAKAARVGDAQFMDDLPLEVQVEVVDECAGQG
ncbi:hypothetical protein [Plantactinospora sp. WMMB782]|uniref:hypothetical protein n=1 Tax=Plantactinospora sp. WMMB782 TaxID=3404121 RepID=UPI003B94BE2D